MIDENTTEQAKADADLTPGEVAHIDLCKEIRAAAALSEDGLDIPLLRPVTIAGARRETLFMRRMRARDMMAMQKRAKAAPGSKGPFVAPTAVENGLWLLARLADVSPDDLEELDMTDLDLMRAALAGFQGGRPTGT